MKAKCWIIYTEDNVCPQVLSILKRSTFEGARFAAFMIHRTNHYGDRQSFEILGPFQTENEAEEEIKNRGWQYIKPDRSHRIIYQLQKMLDEGEFDTNQQLKNKIEELITGFWTNKGNLIDYRKTDSREKFGDDLIDAFVEAIRKLEKRFGGERNE